MTKLTRPMAQRLAEFIHMARDEWNTPGILAALEQASTTSDALAIARALVNIADDPSVKTPGMLTRPGQHWRTPTGDLPPRRGEHNVPCVDHPTYDMPCPHLDHHGQMTLDEIADAKAAVLAELTAARTTPTQPRREPDRLTESIDRLEQVRSLIPQEAPDA